MASRLTLRKDSEVYLIGSFSPQIIGNKLPSKKQVLKVLFFNLRIVRLNLQESARLTIQETVVFWNKARIPTQSEKNCVPKLKKLYEDWRSIQKFSSRAVEKRSIENNNRVVNLENMIITSVFTTNACIHTKETKFSSSSLINI